MTGTDWRKKIDAGTLALIRLALEEDHAWQDVSTQWTVPPEKNATAILISREKGIFCGGALFAAAFQVFDPDLEVEVYADDGGVINPGFIAARIQGKAAGILPAERVALNLLGRLSGIASMAASFMEEIRGTSATICDTRKTVPLWRSWEKYAVRTGGGSNHRENLEEMVLLKDNHIAIAGGPVPALKAVKAHNQAHIPVEIEVENLEQLAQVLEEGVERILLDNMSLEEMREAVRLTDKRAQLEASGGIRLDTVRKIAETGVDFISIGALTHSVRAFDFTLEMDLNGV